MYKYSLLLCLLLPSWCWANTTLTFTTIGESLNSKISKQVLSRAYAQLNIEIKVLSMPASRALKMADNFDGELYRIQAFQQQYPKLLMLDVAVNQLEVSVFSRHTDPAQYNTQNFGTAVVGIRRGILFSERITTQTGKVVKVDSNIQLFQLLQKRRVDIVIMAKANGLWEKHKHQLHYVKVHNKPLYKFALYHFLHPKHHSLTAPLSTILQQMQKQGEITQIRQQAIKNISLKPQL